MSTYPALATIDDRFAIVGWKVDLEYVRRWGALSAEEAVLRTCVVVCVSAVTIGSRRSQLLLPRVQGHVVCPWNLWALGRGVLYRWPIQDNSSYEHEFSRRSVVIYCILTYLKSRSHPTPEIARSSALCKTRQQKVSVLEQKQILPP